jgi:sulfatase maturation enzyme AslB (radical SAM superfamily)
LDGLREEHDYIRGSGVFDRAVDNYSGDKRVIANCILSRMNYNGPDRLRRFISFVRQIGISGLVLDVFIPRQHMERDDEHCLDKTQFQEIKKVLVQELKRPDNILLATPDLLDFQTGAKPRLKQCSMMQSMAKVTADYHIQERLCGDSDCSRCRSIRKYDVPVYDFGNWFAFKLVSYKWMFL